MIFVGPPGCPRAAAKGDLRRPGRGGINEVEPELLPNLVLLATALVSDAPAELVAAWRATGGIEVLVSLLEMRTADGPSELHVLALQALHAAGEEQPERTARLLAAPLASARQRAAVQPGVEAAATVRAVKALGRLARPLVDGDGDGDEKAGAASLRASA